MPLSKPSRIVRAVKCVPAPESGFSRARSALLALMIGAALVAAAWVGVITARPRIPANLNDLSGWAPLGKSLPVLESRTPATTNQRHLNDLIFATSAGIQTDSLPFHKSISYLERGTVVEVLKADLDFLLVRAPDLPGPVWVEARALGVEPPKRSKSRD